MHRRMTPVPFTDVTLTDSFWAPRQAINRSVTLPREYDLCEQTGRIAAWDLAWEPDQPNMPHVFWDSDVAKWIEAASYSLATHPDPALDALLDRVIERIVHAQTPEGYLNSAYQTYEKHDLARRWTNLRDKHELYCAGHLFEAGVAHFQATGKRTLLDPLCRYADYIGQVFGTAEGQLPGYCGHQEIELALVKLAHVTGEQRYMELARYFIDQRGQQSHYFDQEAVAREEDPLAFRFKNYEYNQSHVPVREQSSVTGHAVRAMYMYTAMADLANEYGDTSLLEACRRLWSSVVDQRMYITGGIGPSASNEGFTSPYDLPDETAYAETCAAVGMVFWNQRMLQFEGDGRYADILERSLYNGCISGVSLDGMRFFYDNPLAARGTKERSDWFDCACCPPNIARLIASVGSYFYSVNATSVWVHLYAQGVARVQTGNGSMVLRQETTYPWDGNIRLILESVEQTAATTIALRIPGWCRSHTISLNGQNVATSQVSPGYIALERTWQAGDVIELTLEMPVERVRADLRVRSAIGRVALQRGPIVYCLEGHENPATPLDRVVLPPDATFSIARSDLLGGIVTIQGPALLANATPGALYRSEPPAYSPTTITAIPYCVWANRTPAEMRVWLRER